MDSGRLEGGSGRTSTAGSLPKDDKSEGRPLTGWSRKIYERSLLVAIVVSVLGFAPCASASLGAGVGPSLGAGVGASPLGLASPIHPGSSAGFVPELLVVNTGTDPANYELRVERLSKGTQLSLPAAWVQFAGNRFELAPNARRLVLVRVNVPSSAADGSYRSDVIATGELPSPSGHASARAAAATPISLTVVGSSTASTPWWVLLVLGGVILLVVLVILFRRSGIRLKIERTALDRPTGGPPRHARRS